MRTLFASVLVLSSIALVPAAQAAALSATGTVKSYDAAQKTLKLTNGKVYQLGASFRDPGLKSGEKVKVSYEKSGSRMQADTVTILH